MQLHLQTILLAALLDNHIQQGNELGIDPRQIVWKRCLDMNDRVLTKYCCWTWQQNGWNGT